MNHLPLNVPIKTPRGNTVVLTERNGRIVSGYLLGRGGDRLPGFVAAVDVNGELHHPARFTGSLRFQRI